MIQNVGYSSGPPSHMDLSFEYRTPILSGIQVFGIQMVTVYRKSVFLQPIMSLDCGSGPLSSADWNLSNSLLVAVAVRSDVTVWDLSKMAPVSKTYLRQVINNSRFG